MNMQLLTTLSIFVATIAAMEVFAYAMHRWVMHGPGWFLHASHHRARTGPFEWNDLYAVLFAIPSIALLWLGVREGWGAGVAAVGAGIAAYGAIYFGFHDWIVHRLLPHRIVPRSDYFKRIVQAHRLHHVVESREGTVSFGFLYAPPLAELRAALRASGKGELREPALASD
jgi:beta-carotene 3-hydroxylase